MRCLGERIIDDLPRIDICGKDAAELIGIDRGLLHSPHYPESAGQELSCQKQLKVQRESRLRLFMLEKTTDVNVRVAKSLRRIATNELFDVNVTKQKNDEIVHFELRNNAGNGGGRFLLYFQSKPLPRALLIHRRSSSRFAHLRIRTVRSGIRQDQQTTTSITQT